LHVISSWDGGYEVWRMLNFAENGKNAISMGKFLAENGKKALFRPKIQTWTTMPLKVGIIATFRGLLSDWSTCPHALKHIQNLLQKTDDRGKIKQLQIIPRYDILAAVNKHECEKVANREIG
jgi:hypothetical protein